MERMLFSFKKGLFLKIIEKGEEVTISGWTGKISGMVKRRNRGVLEQSSVNTRDERESDERVLAWCLIKEDLVLARESVMLMLFRGLSLWQEVFE